jgi:hypothetical protein
VTTIDTFDLWLLDEHESGEYDKWLLAMEDLWQPVAMPEPPPTPKPVNVESQAA